MPSSLLLAPVAAFLLASPVSGGGISHAPSDSPGAAVERPSVRTFPGMAVPSPSDGAPSMTTARRSDGQASATAPSGGKPSVHDGGIKEAEATAGTPSCTESADG